MQSHQDHAEVSNVLALDVGGTFIKSALFSGGKLRRELPQVPSCSGGSRAEIIAALRQAVEAAGPVDGIGMAIPGPFDYRRGVSLMEHKFAAIRGCVLREFFPEVPMRFVHDAHAFLLGEWRGERRLGGITLGTGLGAAVMIDGALLQNELGSPAEEVSLWSRPFRGETVEKALRLEAHGPDCSAREWMDFGQLLAEMLTPWCRKFELEAIVFGGQISRDFERFRGPLAELPGRCSEPGKRTALAGAASLFNMGQKR